MNSRLVVLLFASCALSFGVAVWAFTAGAGFLVAFLVYSLGGSSLMMLFTALSYMAMPRENAENLSRLDDFRSRLDAGYAEAEMARMDLIAA